MAKILDATGSISSIDSIILEAKRYIILVSPFWACPKNVVLSLLGALKNGVQVVIFCRPTQKNGKEIRQSFPTVIPGKTRNSDTALKAALNGLE